MDEKDGMEVLTLDLIPCDPGEVADLVSLASTILSRTRTRATQAAIGTGHPRIPV